MDSRNPKNPAHLRQGRPFANFPMRSREAVASWVLAAVRRYVTGHDWTFSTDPTGGDSILLDRAEGIGFVTEHVFVRSTSSVLDDASVEERILDAIRGKVAKGSHYAAGKVLVVFSDARGPWHPYKLARLIEGMHQFDAIWVVGLESVINERYTYWASQLDPRTPKAWRICIAEDFASWDVEPIRLTTRGGRGRGARKRGVVPFV